MSTEENPAVVAARKAQAKVEACLDEGRSFRLEAGAGAGKTYSLVAALKKLIQERGRSLLQSGKRVACITFTEVARDEIAQEIEAHPAILVDTIHGFSWGFMAQFQHSLRELIATMEHRAEKIAEGGGLGEKPVTYDLGFFRVTDDQIALHHDDVPWLMSRLIANEKFRRLLTQQFPVIFIDEYQDTDSDFMAALSEHVFTHDQGPLVGLFGDHWQTIYRKDYALADYAIEGIDKGSNFRSVQCIVDVLNALRPELEQVVRDPGAPGEARLFHSNLHVGERAVGAHVKNDLLPEQAQATREKLMARLEQEGWDRASTKILMLTHSVLAAEQGYPGIAKIFQGRTEQFVKLEEPTLALFAQTVEPMCAAYQAANYGKMFEHHGSGPAIRFHDDKVVWRTDMDALVSLRLTGTIGDVVDHLKVTRKPGLPQRLLQREEQLAALAGASVPEDQGSLGRYQALREIPYAEVLEVVKFIERSTPFATQHGVKGAEFENVLVVLGGGWNQYNWPQLFELLETNALTNKNTGGFYRARNLFYVSISRPKKRLAVLVTQTLSPIGLKAANRLFGNEGVEALALDQLQ